MLFQMISVLNLSPAFRSSNTAGFYLLWELSVATLLPCFIRHNYLLKIAQLQKDLITRDRKDFSSSETFKKYKYYSSERMTWINFALVAFMPVVTTLVFFSIGDPFSGRKFEQVCHLILFIQVIITSIYCVYYLYGQEPDNYGIKLQYICSVCIIAGYAVFLGLSYALKMEIVATFASILAPIGVCLVDLVWPVYVCRKITKDNLKTDFRSLKQFSNQTLTFDTKLTHLESVLDTVNIPKRSHSSNYSRIELEKRESTDEFLDMIISSYALSEQFGNFLAKDYSVQNLLFVERVSCWRSAEDDLVKADLLANIIENFLDKDAVNQICIPGSIAVMRDIDPVDCILQADVHIRNLIHQNHLNRFYTSL